MPGAETKFFLSYAREDAQVALKLAKELRAAGANLWMDQLDIRAGDHWDRAVEKGLEVCGGMLLILSPDAVASDNVMDEVAYALDKGKRVVPVVVRECQIPFRLRRVQYIDLAAVGEEPGMVQVLAALGIESRPIPEATPTAPTGTSPRSPSSARDSLVEQSVDRVVGEVGGVEGADVVTRPRAKPLPVGEDEHARRDEAARREPGATRPEGQGALGEERRAPQEAEEAGPQLPARRRRWPVDWRRTAFWLTPVLLGGLGLLGVLIAWRHWTSMPPVQITAEEQTRRDREAKEEQERQAALERTRQTKVAAEEQAKRDEEAKPQRERQATPEGEAKALAGMVRIPAGEFWMGCNEKVDPECFDSEKPGRSVNVDAFSIDRTEVTVAQYQKCVKAGKCTDPATAGYCNWKNSGRDNYPIDCVAWSQAKTYCEWAGKRLPTEAEWEKAARGTDGRIYPWGNDWSASKANVGGDGAKPVGSYPWDASPYGAVDMAGNVGEWVADKVGAGRGLRGGSWDHDPRHARASYRGSIDPGNTLFVVGFRCAQ